MTGVQIYFQGNLLEQSSNPTIADSKTNRGTGKGIFTDSISGLSPNVFIM